MVVIAVVRVQLGKGVFLVSVYNNKTGDAVEDPVRGTDTDCSRTNSTIADKVG